MADILPEKWMKGVAATTTVLAVCASIAASRGTTCVAKAQLLTSIEGSKWGYYQAKSIKHNLLETQVTAFEIQRLGSLASEQRARLEQQLQALRADVTRYDTEKEQIRQEAEAVGKENAIVNRRGGNFSLAVVFIQIGIMLSSVSALLKRKALWALGLVAGVIGMVYLANGVFLFF